MLSEKGSILSGGAGMAFIIAGLLSRGWIRTREDLPPSMSSSVAYLAGNIVMSWCNIVEPWEGVGTLLSYFLQWSCSY